MKSDVLSKNYVVNEALLRVCDKLHLSINEFLVLMYLVNTEYKELNIDCISEHLYISAKEVLKTINSLTEKQILEINSQKNSSGKMADFIKLDGLLDIIKKDNNESKKTDIYSLFEKEFGRTISSMEYEIINAWIEKGFSEEIIIAALKESVYNGVRNLRYIDKILYEWKKNNINKADDIETFYKSNKSTSKKSDKLFDYNWLDDESK